jgi:hypothetical protein
MNAQTKRFSLRTAALVIAIALVLIAGIGVTGAAARSAIPGDALYPVKTTIEQTRLNLAGDAGDRAVMKMGFAEQRLAEIRSLIAEGRYGEVNLAVLAFESEIHGAILEVETVAQADPARAARLAMEIVSALTRYAQALSELAATAPDAVRAEVTRALDTTQLASGLDMPSADDAGSDNANDDNDNDDNDNDDNGNDNTADDSGNDNTGDDNGNDNSADDNGNDNSADDNGNDNTADDNGNDNANDDNGNDNTNDDSGNDNTGDDNGNDNTADDNGNDNANDDSGNDNTADDNGNDNADDGNSNDNGSNDNGDDNGGDSGKDDGNGDDNSGKGKGGKDDN